MSMMGSRKLVCGTVGIVLLSASALFSAAALYLAWSEVLPAIRKGHPGVETNSMILNVYWEGNEIYVLLVAYLLLAGGLAYGATRAFKAAIRSK